MTATNDNEDITVVRLRCGHIALAVVTSQIDSKCKLDIGDLIVDGAMVEHMPARTFRQREFGCGCGAQRQPSKGSK